VALDLNELLIECVERDASDLHVKADSPPLMRIYGDLYRTQYPALAAQEARDLVYSILTEEQIRQFEHDLELDVAYEIESVCRFRVNVMQQRGSVSGFYRMIPFRIRTMEELNLPAVCWYFAERPRGLVVVTGPAGSGKSTSQAALINYVNNNFPLHVVTVEDPVEFVHDSRVAIVDQREVGRDTHAFANALKWVLRQDPDVILVGEMRDLETVRNTITAAETGHLVLTTLHTQDSVQTIDRIVDIFPMHQQPQVRQQLSANLIGVLSQTLCKRKDGRGRIAAFETLVGTPSVRNLVREAKTYQIASHLQTGMKQGMMTLDQCLARYVVHGLVAYEEGLARTTRPGEFEAMVREAEGGPEASVGVAGG